MCGIVGYIGKRKYALNVLIDGLKHLEYRGYDSAGVAYIMDNNLIIKKTTGRIDNLVKIIDFEDKTNIGIGHTRWATHGLPTETNAHPHSCKDITIVHNGIIENYLSLKESLSKKGYKFISETDTEVAATLLYDLYQEDNDMINAIIKFKKVVEGSYAILVMCKNEPDTLYAIKNKSPLIIGIGDNENYLASDIQAFLSYTNKYVPLEDGYFAKITKDNTLIYDDNNKQVDYKIRKYDMDFSSTGKGNYEHYMLKEIHEQPRVIDLTINNNLPNISKYKNVVIVACGSAMHAGLVGAYLIEKYVEIPTTVYIASEFRYQKLFLNEDTLVIAISQSGETADTLEAVKIAKKYHATTLGIVNVYESSIAREVDEVIYTRAGSEIAVATTKAYLAQVLTLSMLAYTSSKENTNEIKTYMSDLTKLSKVVDDIIKDEDKYKDIAKKIYHNKDMFYIGRGIDYAVCMEGSLKIKEISYIHSEAYPAGELKHGTISLIENNLPVLGIVTDKFIASKTISNLKEVKARGAYIICLTTKELAINIDFCDELIILPTINPLLQPIVNIIPLQLIAYYVAKYNNCDIDKPKNLAKSVTVE